MTKNTISVKLGVNMRRLLNTLSFLLPLTLPLYVIRFNIGPLPTTVLEMFLLVFIATWIALNHNHIKKLLSAPSLRRWLLPLSTWLLVTLLAVFVAQDSWGAFGHWRAFMLEPVLMFVVLMDLLNTDTKAINDDVTKKTEQASFSSLLLYGIAVITIAMGTYAIVQFLTGWGVPAPWDIWIGRRATGVFGFPNGLSLFMAPFGVVCFMEWIRRVWEGDKQSTRLLFLLGAAAGATSVLLAKSMGGILAFCIGAMLTLCLQKQTRKIGLGLGLIGLMGAAIVAASIYRIELHPQNVESSVVTQKKWSSMVRTVIWTESWQVIRANPILGTGLRSYKTAVAPYHTATWMEIYPHPHNIFLMLWIETGILGLLTFIWICLTWTNALGTKHKVLGVNKNIQWQWLIPLIVILIHGLVDMPYFKNDLAVQFWLLAALATYSSTLHTDLKIGLG